MNVKDHIKETLDDMKQSGKINEYIHEQLLERLDSMTVIISDCGSVEEAVKAELYGLGIEPGYEHYGEIMVPLSRTEALTVYDEGAAPVFAVCSDGTEFELETRSEIECGDYSFAIEKGHTISFRPEMEMRL